MDRQQAGKIKAGAKLIPNPIWNETERTRKLRIPAEVVDVRTERNCQTGVMVKVLDVRGESQWLSAGWFDFAG